MTTNREDLPNLVLPDCGFFLLERSSPAQAHKSPRRKVGHLWALIRWSLRIRCHIPGIADSRQTLKSLPNTGIESPVWTSVQAIVGSKGPHGPGV
jgi:hypothetical protein